MQSSIAASSTEALVQLPFCGGAATARVELMEWV